MRAGESPDANGAIDVNFAFTDGTPQTHQFNGSDFLPPDPPTTLSSAISPMETCTAGGYCPWSMTAKQGAAVSGGAAAGFAFASQVPISTAPGEGPREVSAFVTGLAAADLAQQAAQQKKKKNKKK